MFIRKWGVTVVLFLTLALVLGGCVLTRASLPYATVIQVTEAEFGRTLSWPSKDSRQATAQLGEAIFVVNKVADIPTVDLPNGLRHSFRYDIKNVMNIEVMYGTLEPFGRDAMGGKYFASTRGVRYAWGNGPYDNFTSGGVHVSATGQQSIYWAWNSDYPNSVTLVPLPQNSSFTVKINERPMSRDKLRRELVYLGESKGSVSILYREFVNDMVRPSVSQELKYDSAPGTVVTYRGARFEVLDANNTLIRYRVIEPLSLIAQE